MTAIKYETQLKNRRRLGEKIIKYDLVFRFLRKSWNTIELTLTNRREHALVSKTGGWNSP